MPDCTNLALAPTLDRLAQHQFDRHGTHLWRETQALPDHEHARHALG